MIDLHTHTTESDGTLSPEQLVAEGRRIGLQALAITDHDTFGGYDAVSANAGLELICGIELATRFRGRSVHLLGYFLHDAPSHEFREWVVSLQQGRTERNRELVERLCAAGMPVTLEEIARRGRTLIARPHFAAVMVEKGYVKSADEAFDKYLDESGACFVPREEAPFENAVARIRAGGGIAVLPHPNRIRGSAAELENMIAEMRAMGLDGIEVYHSDHSADQVRLYLSIAARLQLRISGGSDFHGAAKPRVALGTGINENLNIAYEILEKLRT